MPGSRIDSIAWWTVGSLALCGGARVAIFVDRAAARIESSLLIGAKNWRAAIAAADAGAAVAPNSNGRRRLANRNSVAVHW